MNELRELKSTATPTTIIGDDVIIGFNKEELKEKLGI